MSAENFGEHFKKDAVSFVSFSRSVTQPVSSFAKTEEPQIPYKPVEAFIQFSFRNDKKSVVGVKFSLTRENLLCTSESYW